MSRTFLLACSLAFSWVGCGDDGGGSSGFSLQNSCVADQLNLSRSLPDGEECGNFGFTDCGIGFASECEGFCARDLCQPEMCTSAEDCVGFFGELPLPSAWECTTFEISSRSYGDWCEVVETCPEGTVNCPCTASDTCGRDPFGTGNLICENGRCRSSCPRDCQRGGFCCGGALCAGECIGTSCC